MKMDNIEKEIVKKYVRKDKQERILWELNNPKKRDYVIWRFSGPVLFKTGCLRPIEYMSNVVLEEELFRLGGTKEVYFIGESRIGLLPLKVAVTKAHLGEMCIIYCGNGIGYYQGEQEYGHPPRYLLLG